MYRGMKVKALHSGILSRVFSDDDLSLYIIHHILLFVNYPSLYAGYTAYLYIVYEYSSTDMYRNRVIFGAIVTISTIYAIITGMFVHYNAVIFAKPS